MPYRATSQIRPFAKAKIKRHASTFNLRVKSKIQIEHVFKFNIKMIANSKNKKLASNGLSSPLTPPNAKATNMQINSQHEKAKNFFFFNLPTLTLLRLQITQVLD